MDLTIPTPEGPFESIVFLGDGIDWPAWYDDVRDIALALDVWQYVDPDGPPLELCEPARPAMPTRPVVKFLAEREQFETDRSFDLRVEEERHAHALAVREYDMLCERYRADTARYVADLAAHASSRDHLQKLYRTIYRSIPDRYRAYLRLDAAKTPREMVSSLRSRVGPPADKDRASAALRAFNSKLNVQPGDDKEAFIEAIALATVELHRYKGDRFDQGTAVKDLLRSLRLLDEDFAESWLRKEGRHAVLDIVEDFKKTLRRPHGKASFAREQKDGSVPDVHVPPKHPPAKEPVLSSSTVDGSRDGQSTVSENGSAAPSKNKKNKSNQEPPSVDYGTGARIGYMCHVNHTSEDPLPAHKSKPSPSSRASSVLGKENKPPRTDGSGVPKKTSDAARGPDKAKKAIVVDRASSSAPAATQAEKQPSAKDKKSPEDGTLVKKTCPGCELKHLIRADAWWENCFVYWQLQGLDDVPSFFHCQERKLDLVFSRLQDCPDEKRRAEKWLSRRAGAQKKSGAGANGSGSGSGKDQKANTLHHQTMTAGAGDASHHGMAAGSDDVASNIGSVASTSKGQGKSKGKGTGTGTGKDKEATAAQKPLAPRPSQSESKSQDQTSEEFNLW
ncbi:hypothetical protein E4U41_000419 [Claviceps citrina]|nr:hypothetical protein E4U41_000419 [Claviceps citrina]